MVSQEAQIIMAKSVCPITREEFRAKARPVTVTIGNAQLPADEIGRAHV